MATSCPLKDREREREREREEFRARATVEESNDSIFERLVVPVSVQNVIRSPLKERRPF